MHGRHGVSAASRPARSEPRVERQRLPFWLVYVVPALLVSFCGLAAVNLVLLLRELPADAASDLSRHARVAEPEPEPDHTPSERHQEVQQGPGPLPQAEGKNHPYAVSWAPRVFVVPDVLTPAECDQLVNRTSHLLQESKTYLAPGKLQSEMRTSSSAFVSREPEKSDEWLHEIRRRLLHVLQIPSWFAENLQIARYREGEQYKFHYDFSMPGAALRQPRQFPYGDVLRSATLIVYLSDGFEGGETVFPMIPTPAKTPSATGVGPIPESVWPKVDSDTWLYPEMAPYCQADSAVLKVKPPKGSGVLFYDFTPDNRLDMQSLHGGCPPRGGTKHIAQQWVQLNREYTGNVLPYEANQPGGRKALRSDDSR